MAVKMGVMMMMDCFFPPEMQKGEEKRNQIARAL